VKWETIRRTAANGTCWLVTTGDGRIVGTITAESEADPYWLPSDDPDDALYIHRMVVDSSARGSELGSALLDWAARRARQAGKSWLRLDAWKSNPALHKYYLDRGFRLVETMPRTPGPPRLRTGGALTVAAIPQAAHPHPWQ
jgi:GNAT superfamily N-acetyltransferase